MANTALGAGAIFEAIHTSRFDLKLVRFLNNSVLLGYVLRYIPSQIEPNLPTMQTCSFFENTAIAAVFIPHWAQMTWTCSPGQFAPKAGAFRGNFIGCPLNCAVGHFSPFVNETSPDCAGTCPVRKRLHMLNRPTFFEYVATLTVMFGCIRRRATIAPRAHRFQIPAPLARQILSRAAQGLTAAFHAIPVHTAMASPAPT